MRFSCGRESVSGSYVERSAESLWILAGSDPKRLLACAGRPTGLQRKPMTKNGGLPEPQITFHKIQKNYVTVLSPVRGACWSGRLKSALVVVDFRDGA